MTRYAKATDSNHAQIRDQLRKLGVWVWDTHALGNGFPDLLACARGRFVLLELKDPSQPPSKRRLTKAEQAFYLGCPGPIKLVMTVTQALVALGMAKEGHSPPGG